jgi:hypothetical protein
MDDAQVNIEDAPAYWLIGQAVVALAVLMSRAPAFLANAAGWRAFVVPLMLAVLGIWAGASLLRSSRCRHVVLGLFGIQLLALSLGPVAYRLVVGPYLLVHLGPGGWHISAGVDAHYLAILGSANRVPAGLAVNVIALLPVIVLLTRRAHRPSRAAV